MADGAPDADPDPSADSALSAPPTRHRAALFVAAPIGVALVLFVGVLFSSKSAGERAAFNPLVSKPAPAIIGTTLDGKPFNLDRLRGEWVAVNFFATWCVPCQQEHPLLLAFANRHRQVGDVQLVTVVFQDDPRAVKDFFATRGGDWPVVNGDQGSIALDYSVIKVPETYIIDPLGIVRGRVEGPLQHDGELDDRVAALAQQLADGSSTTASSR